MWNGLHLCQTYVDCEHDSYPHIHSGPQLHYAHLKLAVPVHLLQTMNHIVPANYTVPLNHTAGWSSYATCLGQSLSPNPLLPHLQAKQKQILYISNDSSQRLNCSAERGKKIATALYATARTWVLYDYLQHIRHLKFRESHRNRVPSFLIGGN